MGVLHIILKVGHPKIISTQISEQKILMWFLSHNIPKRNKLAEKISQKNPEYMLNYSLPYTTCSCSPFSINFRCQIENQVSDYRLLGASSFISSPCKHINPNGDICLSVVSFLLHLSSWFLMGIFVEYELIFPMSLMAISYLLKSKGITPDITSIASRH
jgi:hypothetical protein